MPLPPAEKLPLAARKDVRDEYENNKADFEKQISDILGEEWKIEVNALALYPYMPEGSTNLGSYIKSYVEGAIWKLKYYIEQNGDIAKKEINTICHAHTITFGEDEVGKFSYGGVVVEDGNLKIVFKKGNFGTNASYTLDPLTDALNDAEDPSKTALSVKSRYSVEQDYNKKIEDLTKKFETMLAVKPFTLNPNFEDNFAALKNSKKARDDWQQNLGGFTYAYFEGVEYQMNYKKFGEDDMLQEGFNDVVDKKEVTLRVVDKLNKGSGYSEILIESGVLVLQTTPDNFGTNVSYVAEGIIDLL